jgi:hypothetical protein
MLPGRVGFGEEGDGVVQPGDLRGLVDGLEVGLRRPLDDGLPYFSTESLVGVGRVGQLGL